MLQCYTNTQEPGRDINLETGQTQREKKVEIETRMFSRFKYLSRAVHEEHQHEDKHDGERVYPRTRKEGISCTSLTVWRKSLVMNCKGFTVIDSDGNLVYRVDNYTGRPEEVVLMDASGNSVLTMLRRKKLGLVDSWVMYEGEVMKGKGKHGTRTNPICCVRKNMNMLKLLGNPNVKAYVYHGGSVLAEKRYAYAIEGSYSQRMCKVLDESRTIVAEIKRKEAISKHVSFGIEIFQLVVHPGFDAAFAMALVLLLDQMFS